MTFRVGQKVVCIDDKLHSWPYWAEGVEPPVKGEVYTVASMPSISSIDGTLVISLLERRNPFGGFRVTRFRPVVDKTTDIGFAHEILRKAARTKETAAC
jgi:hypothetical protein